MTPDYDQIAIFSHLKRCKHEISCNCWMLMLGLLSFPLESNHLESSDWMVMVYSISEQENCLVSFAQDVAVSL